MQSDIDQILKNSEKIGDVVDRLSSIDQMLEDADSRIEAINTSRKGIANIEERLVKLSKNADDQLKALRSISQASSSETGTKRSSRASNTISPQTRESVSTLRKQGWTIPEIAKNLKLSENEVQLIIDLNAE